MGEITPNTNIQFDAMRLINRMLSQDPHRRPSAHEVCNDAWLMTNGNDQLNMSNAVKFMQSPSVVQIRK